MWYWGSNSILYGEKTRFWRPALRPVIDRSAHVLLSGEPPANGTPLSGCGRLRCAFSGSLLLDLYCSTGTIGLTMAKQAGRLIRGGGRRIRCKRRQRKCGTEWDQNAEFPLYGRGASGKTVRLIGHSSGGDGTRSAERMQPGGRNGSGRNEAGADRVCLL